MEVSTEAIRDLYKLCNEVLTGCFYLRNLRRDFIEEQFKRIPGYASTIENCVYEIRDFLNSYRENVSFSELQLELNKHLDLIEFIEWKLVADDSHVFHFMERTTRRKSIPGFLWEMCCLLDLTESEVSLLAEDFEDEEDEDWGEENPNWRRQLSHALRGVGTCFHAAALEFGLLNSLPILDENFTEIVLREYQQILRVSQMDFLPIGLEGPCMYGPALYDSPSEQMSRPKGERPDRLSPKTDPVICGWYKWEQSVYKLSECSMAGKKRSSGNAWDLFETDLRQWGVQSFSEFDSIHRRMREDERRKKLDVEK